MKAQTMPESTPHNGEAVHDDVYWNERDLCAVYGIAQTTAQAWRSKGIGPPHVKLGSGRTAPIRYSKRAALAWLAANEKTSTSCQAVSAGADRPSSSEHKP